MILGSGKRKWGAAQAEADASMALRRTMIGAIFIGVSAVPTLAAPATRSQGAALEADATRIAECVAIKAGPEGDLPPAGPRRDAIVMQMNGGPQACIGLIKEACAGGQSDPGDCFSRESSAWIRALDFDSLRPARNRAAWRRATASIRAQAIRLCEGAAALSAWGADVVRHNGRYGFTVRAECVRDAIAQQALLMLVNVRGN